MFRSVALPENITGRLFLHSMPGRREPFAEACSEIREKGIKRVVNLTSLEEIEDKSPAYAQALKENTVEWVAETYSIPDLGVPENLDTFWQTASHIAKRLASGENILIHCAGGVGRTGMFAASVLMASHLPIEQAIQRVSDAGSSAEAPEQKQVLQQFAHRQA
jgi:protein-tyrosine phosphatase